MAPRTRTAPAPPPTVAASQSPVGTETWDRRDPVGAAREHVRAAALLEAPVEVVDPVGLELELHLVARDDPARPLRWDEVTALSADPPLLPGRSSLTVEPGGQLELSGPPVGHLDGAVDALRADLGALRGHCRERGFALLPWGADPLRVPRRINPGARYAAMAEHFTASGCGAHGRSMMASTAALQVNLDVGGPADARRRWSTLAHLAPVLVAVSACSPYLAGRESGWASMRQQQWSGIDPARTRRVGRLDEPDPALAWADYALAAPVLLVLDGAGGGTAVTERVTFAEWLRDGDRLGRPPTRADLDYHLTTLFPPVRPRGFLEVRCLDSVDDAWWPALVSLVTVLVQDDVAGERVPELCDRLPHDDTAARDGLEDPSVRRAATACVALAADRAEGDRRVELEALAALVEAGRNPGSELRDRIRRHGARHVVEQECHDRPA